MDHPSKVKRGEASIYYRTSLSVTVTGTPYLKGGILFEVAYSNSKILLSTVYRQPSQTNDEFNQFLLTLEKILQDMNHLKPHLCLVKQ